MKITSEFIAKAKQAKSAEELNALAKENSIELTEESAKAYLEQLNPKSGEISDDELDNVVGGCTENRVEFCPRCKAELDYELDDALGIFYYTCPNCDYSREA